MTSESPQNIVPTSELKKLKISEIKPSVANPRHLFDPKPLEDLKESIANYGVLVPLTVYPIRGQKNKYAILDGERRFRCCVLLQKEGRGDILIPANVVKPPDIVAGVLYMFSIHGFREPWELMPTALSLKTVMDKLHVTDTKSLSRLTGMSGIQVERCKTLLQIPKRFQDMSLHIDPTKRVPPNFWIEVQPVIDLCQEMLPDLTRQLGLEEIMDRLVNKYRDPDTLERKKDFGSIIHFRRIIEASERKKKDKIFIDRLRQYILVPEAQVRDTFDDLLPTRNVRGVLNACTGLQETLERLEAQIISENNPEISRALEGLRDYIEGLLMKMKGGELVDSETLATE